MALSLFSRSIQNQFAVSTRFNVCSVRVWSKNSKMNALENVTDRWLGFLVCFIFPSIMCHFKAIFRFTKFSLTSRPPATTSRPQTTDHALHANQNAEYHLNLIIQHFFGISRNTACIKLKQSISPNVWISFLSQTHSIVKYENAFPLFSWRQRQTSTMPTCNLIPSLGLYVGVSHLVASWWLQWNRNGCSVAIFRTSYTHMFSCLFKVC